MSDELVTLAAGTKMQKWQVGQAVVVRPSPNDSRYGRQASPRTTTVTKVGRKFFNVDGESARFHIDDGRQDTEYSGQARRVLTPELHARVLRQEVANRRLRELGLNSTGGRLPYSVEQLEAVIAILENGDAS